MKHRVSGKKLSRDRSARKALFKNLISSFIIHDQLKTTESKAKRVRSLVEKLVTKGKKGTLHSQRLIFAFLQNKQAVGKLVNEIAPVFKGRPGGFTRLIKLGGTRRGDNTKLARLEWVEKPVPSKQKSKTGAIEKETKQNKKQKKK